MPDQTVSQAPPEVREYMSRLAQAQDREPKRRGGLKTWAQLSQEQRAAKVAAMQAGRKRKRDEDREARR
jgi:hypothetical protein